MDFTLIYYCVILGCDQNLLYSFLTGGDPGTVNVINNVMMFGQDVGEVVMPWMSDANCTTGGDWNTTSNMVPPIGSGSNSWTQECLARCGISAPGKSRRFVVY